MDETTYLVQLLRDNWPSTSVMEDTLGIAAAHRIKPTVFVICHLEHQLMGLLVKLVGVKQGNIHY